MADAATQTRYQVGGMDCAACEAKIDTAVRRMAGVTDVSVSAAAGTMLVEHDGSSDLADIERRVSGLGYTMRAADAASPARHDDHDHDDGHGHDHAHGAASGPWWKSRRGVLTIASFVGLVAAFLVGWLAPGLAPWAFGAAMLIGLVPIGRRAVMAALAGAPFTIEMLMLIAAVGAVLIGAVEEAATVVFLFLVGELLEGVAAGKARASIQALTQLVPKTAWLDESGTPREVPASSLQPGARILVRPGDRIPADGQIVSGESAINEAPVTGESTPNRKAAGAAVFAGTVNGDGALRVRVTAAAEDNTIARVVKLVEEAQERKAPTERFIARFSRWYTPGVVVVGGAGRDRPAAAGRRRVGGLDLQGPGHPADRLPLRAGDLDPRGSGGFAGVRGAARPAAEGRRGAGTPGHDHRGSVRQDRHADPGHARGDRRAGFRQARKRTCCAWPPRWRRGPAIRWPRRSWTRPRRAT